MAATAGLTPSLGVLELVRLDPPRRAWRALSALRARRITVAVAGATAIAATAVEADALATAFFVLGVEPARIYCENRPEVGAVLLPAGAAKPVVLGNVDYALV